MHLVDCFYSLSLIARRRIYFFQVGWVKSVKQDKVFRSRLRLNPCLPLRASTCLLGLNFEVRCGSSHSHAKPNETNTRNGERRIRGSNCSALSYLVRALKRVLLRSTKQLSPFSPTPYLRHRRLDRIVQIEWRAQESSSNYPDARPH